MAVAVTSGSRLRTDWLTYRGMWQLLRHVGRKKGRQHSRWRKTNSRCRKWWRRHERPKLSTTFPIRRVTGVSMMTMIIFIVLQMISTTTWHRINTSRATWLFAQCYTDRQLNTHNINTITNWIHKAAYIANISAKTFAVL